MSSQKEITVRLFGAFRDLTPDGACTLAVQDGASVAQIKAALGEKLRSSSKKFDVAALMEKSALATDSKILGEHDLFTGSELAILPPVCGG